MTFFATGLLLAETFKCDDIEISGQSNVCTGEDTCEGDWIDDGFCDGAACYNCTECKDPEQESCGEDDCVMYEWSPSSPLWCTDTH